MQKTKISFYLFFGDIHVSLKNSSVKDGREEVTWNEYT